MESNQPERVLPLTSRNTCYLCSSPAHQHCERCHRPICAAHTRTPDRMSWQQFGNGKESWNRYLPDPGADPWQVCPACAAAIQRHDAQEQGRDRRNLWVMRLILLGLLVGVIALCALVNYLGTH